MIYLDYVFTALGNRKITKIGIYFSFVFFTALLALSVLQMIIEQNFQIELIIMCSLLLIFDLVFLNLIIYRVKISGSLIILFRLFRKNTIELKNIKRNILTETRHVRIGTFTKITLFTKQKKYTIYYGDESLVKYLYKLGFNVK